jgi:hypothetical protein
MLKTTLWAAVPWAAVNSMAGGNRRCHRRVAAEVVSVGNNRFRLRRAD